MPGDLVAFADRLWRGEVSTHEHHPLLATPEAQEVVPGVLFVRAFGNVTALATDDGLVLVDAGSAFTAGDVHRLVRDWSREAVGTVVLTHGHIDHVLGLTPFERDAERARRPRPHVIAHTDMPRRFTRYRRTRGYNATINARQFGAGSLEWPAEYPEPDETYGDRLGVDAGGTPLELRHARGETDDATWVWVPSRGVLCTGDLFIWAVPNAGNPQKAQRYPDEWAAALREMAAVEPEVLLPGHGWPIVGAARVREALETTAELLETLVERTLDLMNAGASLDEVVRRVQAPRALLVKPWLRPVYDDPEFIVRSVWRLYGGWWDGDPATLKPAPGDVLAAEVARLAGGPEALAQRAREVANQGDLRLAGHLAEWAARAAPDDGTCLAVRAEVYERRAAEEPSLMARNLFRDAGGGRGDGSVRLVLVREARGDDWPGVLRLLVELGRPAPTPEENEETLRGVFLRYLERRDAVALVAEDDGEVVGFVNMELRMRLNFTAPEAWLPEVVVDASARRRGVGASLLSRAEEIARERGAWGMSLESATWRREAHAFYEAQGWTHGGKAFTKLLTDRVWPPKPPSR